MAISLSLSFSRSLYLDYLAWKMSWDNLRFFPLLKGIILSVWFKGNNIRYFERIVSSHHNAFAIHQPGKKHKQQKCMAIIEGERFLSLCYIFLVVFTIIQIYHLLRLLQREQHWSLLHYKPVMRLALGLLLPSSSQWIWHAPLRYVL